MPLYTSPCLITFCSIQPLFIVFRSVIFITAKVVAKVYLHVRLNSQHEFSNQRNTAMYSRHTDKAYGESPSIGLSSGMLPKIHMTGRSNNSAFKALYNNGGRKMTVSNINQSIKGVK